MWDAWRAVSYADPLRAEQAAAFAKGRGVTLVACHHFVGAPVYLKSSGERPDAFLSINA
jgi:hypothetical protein